MYQKTNELAGGHEFASAQDMLSWLEKAMTDNIKDNRDRHRFEADPYAYTVNFAQAAGLVLDEVEENSFKQIALTWDELPVTTVEDQTGARAARNSKSGMVKLVLNFCVAQELLVESQDRYYPADRFRSLIENYFDDYRGRFAELMNGGRDAAD